VNRPLDTFWATLGEGSLILVMALIAWASRQPLILASLGPTACELAGPDLLSPFSAHSASRR